MGFVFVGVILAIVIAIYIQNNVQCDCLGMGKWKIGFDCVLGAKWSPS
jgi:hypothetical protein